MKRFFKCLIAGVICVSLLQSAVFSGFAAQEEAEADRSMIYTTVGGYTVEYTMTECTPNTLKESSFSPSGGSLHQWGTEWFYFTDGKANRIYTFSGEVGQMAYLVMDLSQEFLVSVSTDKKNWIDCLNSNEDGRFREMRAIDLSPWFAESRKVYVKLADSIPTTGWGGQIRALRYVTVQGVDGLTAWRNISQGWETSLQTWVDAGQSVSAEAGSPVTFRKTLSVPECWIGGDLAVSFSWVESGETPQVLVNGNKAGSVSTFGNNLTIPLPKGSNGQQVEIEVITTATAEGKCGLWDSVRMGYQDLVMLPESTWSLDGETRKIHENYYVEGSVDLVQLNALAGNYASTLLNTNHNLVGFNNLVRQEISNSQLYYAHDTSRTLTALAFEEMYSPIVRLDLIESLYRGVKKAMVPGSDYELFLKYDARPRNAIAALDANLPVIRMQTHQDVSGQFVDVYAAPMGQDAASLTVSDENLDNGLHRVYTAAEKSVSAEVTWFSGDSDKPTTLQFSGDGSGEYRVVYQNFQIPFRDSLSQYNAITTETDQYVGVSQFGDMEIAPPAEGYLVLSSRRSWTENPTIITWDVAPEKILLKTDGEKKYFTGLEFVYAADAKPTMTTLCFDGVDVELKWPYQVASNIVTHGVYGANGYDPTYVCGVEGLGTGALAAAAYIFKKYQHPLAAEAEALALKASRSAYQASVGINHTPSFYLDRVQAAYFLILMGYRDEFLPIADYYGQYVLREQAANGDGTTNWFDARMPLAMQVAYEATGLEAYREAFEWYLTTITYYENHLEYKGARYTSGSFAGAGEMSYLGHRGDTQTLAKVMQLTPENFDDTGVQACSDLNPYFLGWSLKGMMKVQYDVSELKTPVSQGQFVLYDAEGNLELMDYPTAYINNPHWVRNYRPGYSTLPGDADGDEDVDAADALCALQHSVNLISLSQEEQDNADVTRDGKINASDALKILQYTVGLIEEL